MQVSITAYQVQDHNTYSLTPVCAGLFGWTVNSRDLGKAKQRAIERLRIEIPKLPRQQVARLFVPPGRRLERVHLDFTVRDAGSKKHVAGWFPVVVEPRPSGAEEPLLLAYHPSRPEDWVEISTMSELTERIGRAYARLFDPDDDFDELKSTGRERLVTLRFDAEPPNMLKLLPSHSDPEEHAGAARSGNLDALLRVAINQTARAADGRLYVGLPRERERSRLQQLLMGHEKTPVLVVGPPGCGKSMLIAQAVVDLLEADGYPTHGNLDRVHNVLSMRGRQIIAGMSYVGQWEARAMQLVERAKRRRVVLWSDDVHAWGSIGKTSGSDRVLADFFRGPLARRELIVLGECTAEQLSVLDHEAPAFAATFARVVLEPPSASLILTMVVHESRRLEQELDVAFDPRCFGMLLEQSAALSSGTVLPGRALGPLRAIAKMAQRDHHAGGEVAREILPSDVLHHFSRQTGLPETLLSSTAPLTRVELKAELARQIMGQDVALDAACDVILTLRAKLTADGRPYGVFLFTGPTGTGKTELAKCLAEYLFGTTERLLRFDMSEFSTPDAPARLIGDVFDPNGQLTAAVRAQPFSVLLFDEVEKAHPAVLNLMLQIFEDARLTDARGSVVDFTHSVIILTSNLGAASRSVRGFSEAAGRDAPDGARAVRDFFPPELFNRIDRVVRFDAIGPETAKAIVRKELSRFVARPGLAERDTFVRFTEAVVEGVVQQGYSAEYGARALKRYIDRVLGDSITSAITHTGRAEMRLLWLYRDVDGLVGVRAEALCEAPMSETAGVNSFEELLAESSAELRRRIPGALDTLLELDVERRLSEVGERMSAELAGYRLGENAHADSLFNLDSLRIHVRSLIERLQEQVDADTQLQDLQRRRKRTNELALTGEDFSTIGDEFEELGQKTRAKRLPTGPILGGAASHATLMSDLAEVGFLMRLLEHADEPNRHVAVVQVLRLASSHDRRRFSKGEPGLPEWLASAYAHARGELDDAAVALADGTMKRVSPGELEEVLRLRPDQVVLRLVGPGVADFFAGETGCHLRQALDAGPEIARVRVRTGPYDPLEIVQRHAAAKRAFEAGLEGTGPLAKNPERLLPVIRRFHFVPNPDGPSPARVEDYRHAYVATRRVRHLRDLLQELWLLAACGDTSGSAPPSEATP